MEGRRRRISKQEVPDCSTVFCLPRSEWPLSSLPAGRQKSLRLIKHLIIDSLLHDAMERVEDEDVDGFSLKLIEGLNLLRDNLSKVVENTTSKRFSRLDKTVLDIKKQLNNPTSPPVASSTSGRSYTSVAALPIYRRPPIPPYAPAILLRP